jgi:MFS family permease
MTSTTSTTTSTISFELAPSKEMNTEEEDDDENDDENEDKEAHSHGLTPSESKKKKKKNSSKKVGNSGTSIAVTTSDGLTTAEKEEHLSDGRKRLNAWFLLTTRIVRMFSFGAVAPVLFLHLESLGFTPSDIARLFTGALVGDLLMTFPLTTRADGWGRRRTLMFGAFLKAGAGLVFSLSNNYWVLLFAAIIGVITPTGNEIGPFMAVEQAALTATLKGTVTEAAVTQSFSIYNFVGCLAFASGSFAGGFLVSSYGDNVDEGYASIFWFFFFAGVLMVFLYSMLSSDIEAFAPKPAGDEGTKIKAMVDGTGKQQEQETQKFLDVEPVSSESSFFLKFSGLKRMKSLRTVTKLSCLFVLDSFAGGFVMQTLIVAWFAKKYGLSSEWLGSILSGVNILAGLSALAVVPLVARIGSLRTAVFTIFHPI